MAEVPRREEAIDARERAVADREDDAGHQHLRFAEATEKASEDIQERLQSLHVKEVDLNEQLSAVEELRGLAERERAELARSQMAASEIKQDYERRISEIRQIAASGGA